MCLGADMTHDANHLGETRRAVACYDNPSFVGIQLLLKSLPNFIVTIASNKLDRWKQDVTPSNKCTLCMLLNWTWRWFRFEGLDISMQVSKMFLACSPTHLPYLRIALPCHAWCTLCLPLASLAQIPPTRLSESVPPCKKSHRNCHALNPTIALHPDP